MCLNKLNIFQFLMIQDIILRHLKLFFTLSIFIRSSYLEHTEECEYFFLVSCVPEYIRMRSSMTLNIRTMCKNYSLYVTACSSKSVLDYLDWILGYKILFMIFPHFYTKILGSPLMELP